VTLLSWFLIVTSAVGLLGYVFGAPGMEEGMEAAVRAYGGPSVATQKGWMVGNMLLSAVCGVFMLRGANWARWLLVTATLVGMVAGGLLYQQLWVVVPGLLWLGLYVYLLFLRAPAAAWFSRASGATTLQA
jgi:hypothetical protein